MREHKYPYYITLHYITIVCHTCVGLRFDMPHIKRILIDWLIVDINC